MNPDILTVQMMVTHLMEENSNLRDDLKRLWHFACCPYDSCEKCIEDAKWIKSLHKRLGAP